MALALLTLENFNSGPLALAIGPRTSPLGREYFTSLDLFIDPAIGKH